MPGLVKIGRTNADSVESRIASLNSTGVPLPFECYFAAEVKDCVNLEKTLHSIFSDSRVNPKREFFKVVPEKVVLAIRIGECKDMTPGVTEIDKEERQALEKAKARRPRLTLQALGIKSGDILKFSRDESLIATVLDSGKVTFQDEILSLSAAALKALHSLGHKTSTVNGSDYWVFDGELLDERRNRMDAERFNETSTLPPEP
jgi:hypothetical protein